MEDHLSPLSPSHPQTNTFQVVLATDSSSSYVFFLYGTLQWTNTASDDTTASEELPQVSRLPWLDCGIYSHLCVGINWERWLERVMYVQYTYVIEKDDWNNMCCMSY